MYDYYSITKDNKTIVRNKIHKAKVEETWQKLGLSRLGHLMNKKKVTILKKRLTKNIIPYTLRHIHINTYEHTNKKTNLT